MSVANAAGLVLSILATIYLIVALIKPERLPLRVLSGGERP